MQLEQVLSYGRFIVAAAGTAATVFLGGWDAILQVLVLFVVLDYVTGVLAAWHTKTLNSETGLWGIVKKVLIFAVITVAVALDSIIGDGHGIFRSLAIWFYIANEGLSILENLGRAGVAIPQQITEALERLHDREPPTRGA